MPSEESAILNRQSAIPRRPLTGPERDACRRNGLKGALVWLHMLKQGYMLPAEKLQRVYDGIVKGVLWHLTDCSARYAPRFREGISAVSLVRSLAASGETMAEYARHVRQVITAFTNCRFSIADSSVSELFSSKFEVPGSEDRITTCLEPEGGATARNSELRTPNSELNNFELKNSEPGNRQSTIENRQSLLLTLSTALAEVSWRRFRASRAHAEWERRSVMRLFRRLAGERERGPAVTAQRLVWLAEDLHKVLFLASERFETKLRRLNRRFEALAARILKELGLPPMNLHVRPSPAVNAATASSLASALGNPLQAPGKVRKAAAPRPPRVKKPKDWDHCRGISRPGRRRRTLAEREERVAFLRQAGLFVPGPLWERAEEELENCRLKEPGLGTRDWGLGSSKLFSSEFGVQGSESVSSKLFSSKFEVPGSEEPIADRTEPDAGVTARNPEPRTPNFEPNNFEPNNFELNNFELNNFELADRQYCPVIC